MENPHPTADPAPTAGALWRLTRPGFLWVTVVGCVLGFSFALACGCGFDPWLATWTLLLALGAHAAANVLNDYEDARSGVDAAHPNPMTPFTGGSRMIQQGRVSPRQARDTAILMGLCVAGGGLILALKVGGGLMLIGLAGLLVGWTYSSPPLALMRRGVGELAVALAWWLVVIGADYVQRRHFFIIPTLTAISYALLVANILLINGLPDAESDAQTGKRTLAVRLGPQGVTATYAAIALTAHLWLAAIAWALIPPVGALWGLVSAPLSAGALVLLMRHRRHPQRLQGAIVLTIAAALLHGLGVAAGVAQVALMR